MTDQVDVVVQVSSKLVVDADDGTTCVANELPLRHFIFDVWTCEIDRQHDQ